MNRRGVAFTLVSLLIATTLLTVFYTADGTPSDAYLDAVLLRAETTRSTMSTITEFFPYHVERVIRASLPNITAAVTGTGSLYDDTAGLTNAKATILGCYDHGSFQDPNGSQTSCSSINEETERLEEFVENTTTTPMDVKSQATTVRQQNPYDLTITTTVAITAEDFAAWTESAKRVTTDVELANTPSPLYRYPENSSKRPYEPRIEWAEPLTAWSNQTADITTKRHHFVHYDGAPSFLQRLANQTNKTSPCCGMTSIVNPHNVSNPNNYSNLDHHYLNDRCGNNTYRITFDNVSASEKALYKEDISEPGIEGAVLPRDFIEQASLNDSDILEDVNCA